MNTDAVRKCTVCARFVYWIGERENIRLKRAVGATKPWTDDKILQRYRFCNVRRMDDAVSQWLLHNWYESNHGHKNMLLACALARFINLPASLGAIGFPKRWNPKTIKQGLRRFKEAGNKIFNGAYMVRGNDGQDKVDSVVDYYVDPLKEISVEELSNAATMHEVWLSVSRFYGFGAFMAGQVVADLRWATPQRWSDIRLWAPVGPGSRRGMNRLLGRAPTCCMNQDEFSTHLQRTMRDAKRCLPITITDRMEAIDWQNCLCEFDKYERTLFDGKRPKCLYPGV